MTASQGGTWKQEITTDGTNVLGSSGSPLRTDPTGTTTQPVSGTVGISGALPAGTNDIGTVHVVAPTHKSGNAECITPDFVAACDATLSGLTSGDVLNVLSVHCFVLAGQRVDVSYTDGANPFYVPLSLQQSFGGVDRYSGTLTDLGIPVGTENVLAVQQDYNSSSGNGADCTMSYTATSS